MSSRVGTNQLFGSTICESNYGIPSRLEELLNPELFLLMRLENDIASGRRNSSNLFGQYFHLDLECCHIFYEGHLAPQGFESSAHFVAERQ